MKWFRIWTDIIDDHKIAQLSLYEFQTFIFLLACASEEDSPNGALSRDLASISRRLRRRIDGFKNALETFHSLDLITLSSDGIITITNWNKRQYKSDDTYKRVKKFREVTTLRNVSKAFHETPSDTDTDTDTPIVPKGTAYSVDFLSFWKTYPNRKGKDAAWRSWRKCSGHRPSISQLIEIIEAQKKSEQWKKDNGQFIPHPATWLNQGRWADEPETQKQKARW